MEAQERRAVRAISAVCESRGLPKALSVLRARTEDGKGEIPHPVRPGAEESIGNSPVAYQEVWKHRDFLVCGYKGRAVHFDHRRYQDRTKESRADYDRLVVDLFHNGMKNPLITYKGHILIGMRRFEIMARMGEVMFRCWEITEDVSEWDRYDLPRLRALKALYDPASY